MKYYQVVGNGLWMIDYPHGDSKAHRPGDVFEATPDNQSVTRGLRMGRLREMSDREASALRAAKFANATAVAPTPGLPVQLAEPAVPAAPMPITPTPADADGSGK